MYTHITDTVHTHQYQSMVGKTQFENSSNLTPDVTFDGNGPLASL